jgi:shikimate kinase/3-dehydroquinate synthase
MVAALRVGRALGITSDAAATRLTALLKALGLPVHLRRPDVDAALPFLSLDKKRRGATVRAVFVPEIGAALTHDIPLADLRRLYLDAATD